MPAGQSRLVLVFAATAHCLFHIIVALFLTLVLVLEREWKLGYAYLIALWTIGAAMLGLGAPIAGWLGDRFGEVRMMILYLLGFGTATIACGLATGPLALKSALTAMGLFGAIYHPVGTAWVVKNIESNRGRSLAILGMFGSIGGALSALVAAGLADAAGWRTAFIAPGAVCVAVGLALASAWASGRVRDRFDDAAPSVAPSGAQAQRALAVLIVTMTLSSVIYHAFTTLLPKWIERDSGIAFGQGLIGIGSVVALIYLAGATAQFAGGHWADRGYAKQVYALVFAALITILGTAAQISGWPIVVAAICVMLVLDATAPVEALLIARYTPSGRRGLAFGIRNGIAIVAGPIGIQLVAMLYDPVQGFRVVLATLAAVACAVLLAAMFMPGERRVVAPAAGS
jgi:MFS family permease